MPECESCGKKIEEGQAYLVLIEGAKLYVCKDCSLLGKIISYPKYQPSSNQSKTSQKTSLISEDFSLVENYGQKITQARERLKIPLKVLAERISQKESFLERIEKEKTTPPIEVVRKIEKELGIKLIVTNQVDLSNYSSPGSGGSKSITLGDIIEIEDKKKKKNK
jgi:putative transcription factor